jgi:hypothetical protein
MQWFSPVSNGCVGLGGVAMRNSIKQLVMAELLELTDGAAVIQVEP